MKIGLLSILSDLPELQSFERVREFFMFATPVSASDRLARCR